MGIIFGVFLFKIQEAALFYCLYFAIITITAYLPFFCMDTAKVRTSLGQQGSGTHTKLYKPSHKNSSQSQVRISALTLKSRYVTLAKESISSDFLKYNVTTMMPIIIIT